MLNKIKNWVKNKRLKKLKKPTLFDIVYNGNYTYYMRFTRGNNKGV
jgi:hypothetical protein